MRILVLGHQYVVASSRSPFVAAARLGAEVHFVLPARWYSRPWKREIEAEPSTGEGVEVHRLPVTGSGSITGHFYGVPNLVQIVRRVRPDVVHIDDECYSIAGSQMALIARSQGIPVTVLPPRLRLRMRLNALQRVALGVCVHAATAFRCFTAESIAQVKAWRRNAIVDIVPPFSVDTDLFQPTRQSEGRRFVYVGRLAEEKGLDLLIDAGAQLASKGVDFSIEILGKGDARYVELLKRRVSEVELRKHVVWRGYWDFREVPRAIDGARALVMPSRTTRHWAEMFGLAAVQAMAMGIPVIGSTCGAIPEVVGRDELIFPEGDSEALALRMHLLLENTQLATEISAYSFRRARTVFSGEAVGGQLLDHWRRLLG